MRGKYPWFNEYKILGIKNSLYPYPEKPVYDILIKSSSKYPKNGVIDKGIKYNYPIIKEYSNRFANALLDIGFVKNNLIATILPISIEFIIADYAISQAGLIHVPLSEIEPIEGIEKKIKKCNPDGIICSNYYYKNLQDIVRKYSFKHIIIDKYFNCGNEKVIFMDKLINNYNVIEKYIEINPRSDIETLLYTGGTTGELKGCMLSHYNIYSNVIQICNIYGKAPLLLMKGAIAVLVGIPFFHSYGHIVMHSMMLLGFDIILVNDPRDVDYMAKMIKIYRPVLQFGVPTQYLKIVNENVNTSGIIGISGSAPLPTETQAFADVKGFGIMEGYGLSEMSPVTHFNVSFLYRILGGKRIVYLINLSTKFSFIYILLNKIIRLFGTKTFGKIFTSILGFMIKVSKRFKSLSKNERRKTIGIPLPDVEVKFRDTNGKEVSTCEILKGSRAEMFLNGPQRMLGYYPDVGSGVEKDGFVKTGDVVEIDDNGYFYVVDRVKDMINVSGFKVYSLEVDRILYQLDEVEIAATVGIPDKERKGSERVIVFIKLKDGKHLDEKSVLNYLTRNLPKYAIPKKIYFVNEMPMTLIQKTDKKKL
ncbi:MAG: AMP-binding protein, partial [Deferribacterota bacterium]|nr:AMP-binding protein [Deferribacterota bacterium]